MMVTIMRVNLKIIYLMDMGCYFPHFLMKVSGLMVKNMVKVKNYGLMVLHIKGNINMVKKMVKEN